MTDYTIDPETKQRFCYYKLFGISADEQDTVVVRKAYIRAAAKWHPDRNEDKVMSDIMFKYVQEAWTTLSSPQERAYYDRNRNKILSTVVDEFALKETALNLQLLRSSRCYQSVDDGPSGFYAVYDQCFRILGEEEAKSAAHQLSMEKLSERQREALEARLKQRFPPFGDSNAPRAAVSQFYNFFEGFSTVKLFSQADVYSQEGENSKTRKLIAVENERHRQQMREDFNEKIVELAAYIKRRDPRIEKFRIAELEERQTKQDIEAQRRLEQIQLQAEKDATFHKQMRSRLQELEEKLKQGTITPTEMLEFERMTISSNPAVDKVAKQWEEFEKKPIKKEVIREKVVIQQFTTDKSLIEAGLQLDMNDKLCCIICQQRFQVVGEFKPHLQSKRHKKAEQEAADQEAQNRQMQSEKSKEAMRLKEAKKEANKKQMKSMGDDDNDAQILSNKPVTNQKEVVIEEQEGEMNDVVFKSQKKRRSNKYVDSSEENSQEAVDSKIKQLKEKKQKIDIDPNKPICMVCKQQFDSRSKLFKHIQETGHAALKKDM